MFCVLVIGVLSLHVENLCLSYYSVYKYSREKPVLCDLTIVSDRAGSVDLTPGEGRIA